MLRDRQIVLGLKALGSGFRSTFLMFMNDITCVHMTNAFWGRLKYSYLMKIVHTRSIIQRHTMLILRHNYLPNIFKKMSYYSASLQYNLQCSRT